VPRVLIVYPYMPAYRVPFFEALRTRLLKRDIELVVAHGAPQSDIIDRGDAAGLADALALDQRTSRLFGKEVTRWRTPDLSGVDLVIVEQALRHPAIYRTLLHRPRPCRLAMWGHGRTMTKPTTALERKAKTFLTNRCDWFFAYTAGGRRAVTEGGFPEDRVTVVQNSQETTAAAGPRDVSAAYTGLFIGGLDGHKRIGLLLEATELIHETEPRFRLIVAGHGSDERLVQSAAEMHPWIEHRGYADTAEKAKLGTEASLMLMPGRVGLVAVDAMALGTPLITTDYPLHAPELEYLIDNDLLIATSQDARAYANKVLEYLGDSPAREKASARMLALAPRYDLDTMVNNFVEGIVRALEAGRR
jgi:glycosyltransferase involved in cell wall biosynthesis